MDIRKINTEAGLASYAFKSDDAIYLKPIKKDIRSNFFRDTDKILYSLAFSHYNDKTQVFSFDRSDHITRRISHVLYVSKIARTIGRNLNLNEDLIEAIALGHDLGHVPFGHVGEKILNKISLEHNLGYFNHNVHSVRVLNTIENYGKGLNVSVEVLDGIMCHNGEVEQRIYKPNYDKTKDEFLKEYHDCYDTNDTSFLKSKTLEGCVVRISDLIAYLGRDIEDGIRMKIISKDDIPNDIISILGQNNSQIVNTIILDVINNSIGKDYLEMSSKIFNAFKKLKSFNYKYIYNNANSKKQLEEYELMFKRLFDYYLSALNNNDADSTIISSYLNNMDMSYKLNNSNEQIVLDYIAGMTDNFFIKQYNNLN